MRNVFAVFLAIVFFLLFPIVLVMVTVQTTLLEPAFYKRQLVKSGVYSQWYPIALASVGEPMGFPSGIRLSNAEVERVLRDVVPPEFVQRQTERAIDDFFAWLDSPGTSLNIRIPLAQVKVRLPAALSAAIERHFAGLPPCTGQYQMPALGFPECLPRDIATDVAKRIANAVSARAGEEMASKLPDSIGLLEAFGGSGQDGSNLGKVLEVVKQSASTFESASTVIYALATTLIALIGVLAYGPASRAFSWVGVTLFFSGLAPLLVLILGQLIGLPPLGELVNDGMGGMPAAFTTILISIAQSAMQDFVTRMFLVSGTATGAGLLLLILSRLL